MPMTDQTPVRLNVGFSSAVLRSAETAGHITPEIALLSRGAGVKATLLKILLPGY
jgi:hypothetical protein